MWEFIVRQYFSKKPESCWLGNDRDTSQKENTLSTYTTQFSCWSLAVCSMYQEGKGLRSGISSKCCHGGGRQLRLDVKKQHVEEMCHHFRKTRTIVEPCENILTYHRQAHQIQNSWRGPKPDINNLNPIQQIFYQNSTLTLLNCTFQFSSF